MKAAGVVRIGISGWRYAGWRGVFYPAGLAHRQELAFAARQFGTIEINGTFYSLQKPDYFERWAEETPEDFVFSLKGSRFITHMRKLRAIEETFSDPYGTVFLRRAYPLQGRALDQLTRSL